MRNLLACLFLSFSLAGIGHAAAPERDGRMPATVASALKALAIPPSAVSIYVQEVGAATPRLAINAGRPMNPASVMKLVTTYTALGMLGPAYTWKTEVRVDAPVTDGRLAGSLYIKGSGDPKLTFEQFWLLLRQLRAQGIRDIDGDLVLDRSIFQLPPADDGAFDDQPLRPYNVSPDALLVGFKAIRLGLMPDPATRAVQMTVEPQPANLDVINRIRLGNNGCGDWKEGLRADLSRHAERFRLVVTGSYSASCGQKNWLLGVMPHELYVRGLFEQLWTELGGTIKGGVRDGAAPASARLVASIDSPALAEIVRDINKYSNNVMARQLFLTLGLAGGRQPVRPADAAAAVRDWLAAHGLAFPDLVLENGSGLSRQERVSAEDLGRLLQSAWKSALMPEFVASLPLAAVDGTMKKRFNGNGAAGHMHIKTGTLEGVKSIAGYVLDYKGRNEAVVFIINHPNAQAAQSAQDALLQWVYDGAVN
ncbi:MAG TPA: D-alanyl-D-alanine carboxypeptidase/D-alanyl-D-alanine-endopeptidase [Rhodocyclaceae bacterium]